MTSSASSTEEKGSFTKISIFSTYIALFVNQAILVKLSSLNGVYNYNTTTVVLLTEMCKFFLTITLSIHSYSFTTFVTMIRANRKLCLLYFIPAILYSFHNNLTFVTLSHTDPTTYYTLMQLRVLLTGVVFQILFKRKLNLLQWLSLGLLFIGCIVKEFDNFMSKKGVTSSSSTTAKSFINFYVVVILFQVICSCLAGVYTEYLLKKQGRNIGVHLQNFFMYADSMFVNLSLLIYLGKWDALSSVELEKVWSRVGVIAIIFNGAFAGITTAFLLKYLNSIMKVFANSLEIVFVAVVSAIVLGVPISFYCVASMVMVCGALILYWYGGESPQRVDSKV